MIPVITSEEAHAINVAIEAVINGLESGSMTSKDPELLDNLQSAMKKLRGETWMI